MERAPSLLIISTQHITLLECCNQTSVHGVDIDCRYLTLQVSSTSLIPEGLWILQHQYCAMSVLPKYRNHEPWNKKLSFCSQLLAILSAPEMLPVPVETQTQLSKISAARFAFTKIYGRHSTAQSYETLRCSFILLYCFFPIFVLQHRDIAA